jgi:hypothetical protein
VTNKVIFFPRMNLVQLTRFCSIYGCIVRYEWHGASFTAYCDFP